MGDVHELSGRKPPECRDFLDAQRPVIVTHHGADGFAVDLHDARDVIGDLCGGVGSSAIGAETELGHVARQRGN